MASHPPTLSESALLVIDVQDSFKAMPRWERRSNPAFEANVDQLIQAYRTAGPARVLRPALGCGRGLPPRQPPL